MSSPVVVIGAGVNELVSAHCLARAGHRVLVLERGGARDTQSADDGWVAPRIARNFGLERQGLEIHHPDPWAVPLPSGGRLELWQDMARSVEAIRGVSPEDAAKWPAFCERMARLARLLESVYLAPPPDPMSRGAGDLMQLMRLGLRARGLGRQGIEDLLRILPMPVADLLDDWFESDALKGLLGAAGVMHLHQGPRSGGTAFNLLHGHVGNAPGVFRPARSNLARVLAGLTGVEIRRDAEVARINVREGRATGVVLASGEEIVASVVVSGTDPRRTLLDMVDSAWFDPEFLRAVRNIRCRGVVARVTFALDRAPGFSTLVIAPSLDYLERAHDDAKYGRASQRPHLDTLATEPEPGRHRVEVHVQYAPYRLAEGDWDESRRDALGDAVARMISEHVPDFGAAVTARVVHSPRDLEALEGWPEGQAHHAELALDQLLWMRPLPELARYRTPIAGLYLCGPAMHPGGGIAGAAGYHCAREVLRDFGRTFPG